MLSVFRNLVLPVLALCLVAACDSIEDRVADHYENGVALAEAGETVKAMIEFRNAVRLDEKHAPSYYQMALITEANGNLQRAFALYRKSVDLDQRNTDARAKLAQFLLAARQLDGARTEIEAVLAAEPNRADILAAQVQLAILEGDPAAARRSLAQAQAAQPLLADVMLAEIYLLMETETLAVARAQAETALDEHPENRALHLLMLTLLERQGDGSALGAHLGRMTKIFPKEVSLRTALVRWALQNDDPDLAIREMRALIEQEPKDVSRIVALVRLIDRQKGPPAGRAELERLIATAEEPFPLELLLAKYDIDIGEIDQAETFLRGLVARGGETLTEARVALAQLLGQRGAHDEARTLVDAVLAEDATNVDALSMQVAYFVADNDYNAAIQAARAALNEAPDDVRLLQLEGRAHELSGNINLANDRYAKAVRTAEYEPVMVEAYAQFLIRSNRVGAAEVVILEAVDRSPSNPLLYDLLGFTRLRLENWIGAEEAARALDQLAPKRAAQLRASVLIGQNRLAEGAQILRDTLPGEGEARIRSISALVQTYLNDGDVEEAVAFVEELLAENPDNLQALGLRGTLHAAAGELELAQEKFLAILKRDPENAGATAALSALLLQQGDTVAAAEQLQRGLLNSPDNTILLSRLALIQEIRGDFDGAIDSYERLFRFLPDSLVIANNLASLLSDHRKGNPDAVDRAYEIAGRLRDADIPQYRDTFAWTRYLKGEYDVALREMVRIDEQIGNNPWVKYHLGMVYAAINRHGEARIALEAALELAGEAPFPVRDAIQQTLQGLGSE